MNDQSPSVGANEKANAMIKRCQHCQTWNHDQRGECRKCYLRLKSFSPSDATACSPREPLRAAYSREELAGKMKDWMIEMWGHPMELTEASRDRWMERNGMLYAFICDHFPAENAKCAATGIERKENE